MFAVACLEHETQGMQGRSEPNRELLDAAALCRQLVPEGTVEAFLADHRQELFPDELFSDLFPSGRGRPSVPADVMASVMVLQALEGLSDRDAARALTDRISWKVATGLALDAEGFHPTVLTYWRRRLRDSKRPERVFDAVRSVVEATGVLKGKTRRALDSTLLDDAVATQDTVTQIISAIRRVRREVPGAAEVPLAAHDYEAGAKPLIAWDDPVAKQTLVSALVSDALALIGALEDKELTDEQTDAVGLLALVAGQDVEPGDDPGTWRIAQKVAPDRVISTVDPEARHMHKSPPPTATATRPTSRWSPTPASSPQRRSPRPTLPMARPGWPCSKERPRASRSWPTPPTARARPGPRSQRPATTPPSSRSRCAPPFPAGSPSTTSPSTPPPRPSPVPPGRRSPSTVPATRASAHGVEGVPSANAAPAREEDASINVHPHHDLMVAARRHGQTEEFTVPYRRHRPMVERSIAWLVADGWRRVRYRGVARNQLGLSMRVAAINLRRLVNLGLDHREGWVLGT